jgi:hypothetical protein
MLDDAPEDTGQPEGHLLSLLETTTNDEALYVVCPDCHHALAMFEGTGEQANRAVQAVAVHEQARAALADPEVVRAHLGAHVEAVTFALAINGVGWTGWSVDPATGSVLYLLVNEVAMSEERIQQSLQAQALATDILGYPVVRIVAAHGYVAREFGLVPEPVPST